MSASAAAAIARSAGRGTSLGTGSRASGRPAVPLFRQAASRKLIPTLADITQTTASLAPRVPGGRGGTLSKIHMANAGLRTKSPTDDIPVSLPKRQIDTGKRSSFTASVLSNRKGSPHNSPHLRHGNRRHDVRFADASPFAHRERSSSGFQHDDRFTSRPAGELETQRLQNREKFFSAAAKKEVLEAIDTSRMELGQPEETEGMPFAWGDLSAALTELPDGHWARPFLRGAISSIDANAALGANEKRQMLTQVLQTLAHLSQQADAGGENIVDVSVKRKVKANAN